MKDVIIIGAGGHAAELEDYIRFAEQVSGNKEFNIVGYLDDNPENYARYKFHSPLIGGVTSHKVIKGHMYIIGIANLKYRKMFVEKYKAEGALFASFIHSAAYISESAAIGEGSIIGPHANLGPNVKVGSFTLINSRCSLGHDTVVGDFNFISPNVCFSGYTKIGDENLLGINASTIPEVHVGNRNKIAAGMVLDQNVGDDEVVFYRFKEKVIAVPKR
jgi:sugar O-acyltransferase (sialic acid O-acetyltransferase NeuD family)